MFLIALLMGCALPKIYLPERSLNIVIYTDGTCEYSFENMGSGKREDQEWDVLENPYGEQFIYCNNRNVEHTASKPKEKPEIWPGIGIVMKKSYVNNTPVKSEEGHYLFQPEKEREGSKYTPSKYAENDLAWPMVVIIKQGTTQNEERLSMSPQELYAPCGTRFASSDNPENYGIEYSEDYQKKTGVYIEVTTEVLAVSAAC